jgi:hypothetical protein
MNFTFLVYTIEVNSLGFDYLFLLCMTFFIFSVIAATESIQQSLDLLNMEYGDAGSPAKSSAAEDVFVDRPIFDATPARCPPSVDGAIINSDRTQAGPVFDTTPMPCNKGDAPDFDSTPVYQDTPSQSVDGTEEVTQEYMVQEQLSRYEKAHAARVAAHGEKLTVYYRKKEANLKNVKQTAPVQMPVLHEEPDKTATAEQPRKKPRVAVAKRCVSRTSPSIPPAVGTPRRSPRIINTSQPSPSPDKARPTKRARAADKTYVPDGDDTDFEDDADKVSQCPPSFFIFLFSVFFAMHVSNTFLSYFCFFVN